MVNWIKKRLDNNISIKDITEELLDELVSKDNGNQYGMDNMSSILIKFNKKKWAWSIDKIKYKPSTVKQHKIA